jgi:hypothetical protein
MSDRGTLTQAFNNPGGGFKSIFDESNGEALNGLNGDTLSDVDAAPSPKIEQKTVYVDESPDTPPQLEELNAFIREGWEVANINLGYRKSDDDYCFVVNLEREAPPSLFEVAAF